MIWLVFVPIVVAWVMLSRYMRTADNAVRRPRIGDLSAEWIHRLPEAIRRAAAGMASINTAILGLQRAADAAQHAQRARGLREDSSE